jgi:hypothetical protein
VSETTTAAHDADPGKMPFEDRVREYIRTHPCGILGQCAADLGISYAAAVLACESLVNKGAAEWRHEQAELPFGD